ncbi:MAG: bifunctional folylpolyglutamate synthase/dihydrofolate synthase [Planctomycetes bacterium]|nr:bifunctional folylpolyglutamate synthase/dihydrofolate synthase [Planctomycetota bacterium]
MSESAEPSGRRVARVIAELDQLINWERRKRASAEAMRFSIEPARDLLRRLGDPHRTMSVVHVTGTKGKGSTAALIAAGLSRAGCSTALYTSPHVERLNERLRLDGRDVEDEPFADAVERTLAVRDAALADGGPGADATWFDLVTAAAFAAAADARAKWLVAEVGLGGRLDSTNVVEPEVCVITQVELEHTAILGSTRAAIAREKAGILKRGASLVTTLAADDEAGAVVARIASELEVPIIRVAGDARSIGARNRALADAVLDELGRRGRRAANGRPLSRAFLDDTTAAAAALPGRLEVRETDGVTVVLDGAHVPESVRDVVADLRARRGTSGKTVAVLGMGRDKDLSGMLKALSPHVERVVCTSVGTDLHYTPEEIAGEAQRLGLAAETAAEPTTALTRALAFAREARTDLWVLVIGSLYLAGAVRPALVRVRPERPC